MKRIVKRLIPKFVLRDTFETFVTSAVIYFIVILLYYLFFTNISEMSSNQLTIGVRGLILGIIIPAALAFIFSNIAFFKNKYGTHIGTWGRNKKLLIKVNGDKVVDSDGIFLWGKNDVHIVNIPYSYGKKFSVNTSIEYKNGNLRVSIPATIIIHYNSDFNPQEVYDIVIKDWEDNDLESAVKKTFQDVAEDNRFNINYLIGMYSNKEISEKELLLGISDLIDFPEKEFSNFEKSSFTLGEPQLYVCKGSACVS